jgi:hypothetical protein
METNYEVQSQINSTLNDETRKKKRRKTKYDLDHETRMNKPNVK